MATGRVFDIQRFSTHDGPGIRTTVFLKGCPLRCLWCGNPESIGHEPVLSFEPEKCVACGACFKACPAEALAPDAAGKAVLDRARCTRCGKCGSVCDARALQIVGRDMAADDVLAVVLRDQDYYQASGGGMTLSGGEPLVQLEYAEALLHAAQAQGLHCCVETSGFAAWDEIDRVRPLVNLWLYDIKETDPREHLRFTGVWNTQIVANLERLHASGASIRLRCPMIPQHNARREHLDGLAALARRLANLEGVELLPYYDLWRAKLKRMGLTATLPESVKPPSRETVHAWKEHLRQQGVKVVG